MWEFLLFLHFYNSHFYANAKAAASVICLKSCTLQIMVCVIQLQGELLQCNARTAEAIHTK